MALLVVALSVVPAMAQGAQVEKDYFTGGPVFTPLGTATITNSNYVVTPSGAWQITVQAELNDLNNAPSKAVRWTESNLGLSCWAPGNESINLVITPSGHVSLTCRGK